MDGIYLFDTWQGHILLAESEGQCYISMIEYLLTKGYLLCGLKGNVKSKGNHDEFIFVRDEERFADIFEFDCKIQECIEQSDEPTSLVRSDLTEKNICEWCQVCKDDKRSLYFIKGQNRYEVESHALELQLLNNELDLSLTGSYAIEYIIRKL